MRRRLSQSDVLESWRLDGELHGGHLPSQTIALVSALQDIADDQQARLRALPEGVISPDLEPKWRTRLSRWFGR